MASYDYTSKRIPSGQQTSEAMDLRGRTMCGIRTPAAFTGTSVTFGAAETLDGTYTPIYKAGADLSHGAAASKYITVDPADFAGVNFVKIISGSAEAADRAVTIISRVIE